MIGFIIIVLLVLAIVISVIIIGPHYIGFKNGIHFHEWQYCDIHDVHFSNDNLRYCEICDSVEFLDVDGWCRPMDENEKQEWIKLVKEKGR